MQFIIGYCFLPPVLFLYYRINTSLEGIDSDILGEFLWSTFMVGVPADYLAAGISLSDVTSG